MALLDLRRASVPDDRGGAGTTAVDGPAPHHPIDPADDSEEVDRAAEQLYALPPERFVTVRNGIADRLRAAGCEAEADAVRRLKRPTRAAWALNQVARARPEVIEALLDASAAARTAGNQGDRHHGDGQRAGSGDHDGGGDHDGEVDAGRATPSRQAQRARRRQMGVAIDEARSVLEAARMPSAVHSVALAALLDAAAADPSLADQLRRGRLTGGPRAVAVDGHLAARSTQVHPASHVEPRPASESREELRREERARLTAELEEQHRHLHELRHRGEQAAAACDRAELAVEAIRVELAREEERARKAAAEFHRVEREMRTTVRRVRQLQERVNGLEEAQAPLRRPRRG